MGLSFNREAVDPATGILPPAEQVFVSWLLSMPDDGDLAAAADREIRRLERYRGSHPGPRRLRDLFLALRASLPPGIARDLQ